MLPLPPLDGGHAALAIYERIRSRTGRRYHADFTKLLPLTYAVVMVIVVLGVTTMYLDIVNPPTALTPWSSDSPRTPAARPARSWWATCRSAATRRSRCSR